MELTRAVTPSGHHAYLWWERLLSVAITGALSVALTGIAGKGLVTLNDKKNFVKGTLPGGYLDGQDILGATASVATSGGLSALTLVFLIVSALFGIQKRETKTTITIKEFWLAFCLLFSFATTLTITIIGASKSAQVHSTTLTQDVVNNLVAFSGQKLAYKDQGIVIAAIVVSWINLVSTAISVAFCALAARHVYKHGSEEAPGMAYHHQASATGSMSEAHLAHDPIRA